MIFVTVGTQLPFDRMIAVVDEWAGKAGRSDVVAQIGPTDLRPTNMRHQGFFSPQEIEDHLSRAEFIIAHAGMGTILSALRLAKPIVIMPRRACLSEQRNDHQLATARRFQAFPLIRVAMDEIELADVLQGAQLPSSGEPIPPYAQSSLITCLRNFIESPTPT